MMNFDSMVVMWFSALIGMVVCKTSVVCWGDSNAGGDCSSTDFDVGGGVVESIVSASEAFAAIMNSGADVVCWLEILSMPQFRTLRWPGNFRGSCPRRYTT